MKSAPRKTTKTNTYHGPTPMGLTHWIVFWSLVLCTLVVINAAFAKYQKPMSEVTMEADIAAAIADNLEKQADMLEDQAEALKAQPTYTEEPTGQPDCQNIEVFSAPNAYVTYKDSVTGIQVQLPYNASWGGWRCQLRDPIEVNSSTGSLQILFGPYANYDTRLTSGVDRAYFDASAPTSSAQLLAWLKASSIDSTVSNRTINGIPVFHVDHPAGYDRGSDIWYASGRNYLFRISAFKGTIAEAEMVKIIQSLRVTK